MAIFTVVIPPSITQQWKTLCIVFEFASIHTLFFLNHGAILWGMYYFTAIHIFFCVCVLFRKRWVAWLWLVYFHAQIEHVLLFFAFFIARFQNCLHGWEACYFQSCFHHINSFRATCQITVKMAPWDSFNSDFNYGN